MLSVSYGDVFNSDTGQLINESWRVTIGQGKLCALHGFGRKKDAEIALRVLSETGIDWESPEDELFEQYYDRGGFTKLMELVCERLQW